MTLVKSSLDHKSIHDFVFEMMKELIINGNWPPGKRLMEKEIAKQFDVSRTPIREAFRVLEVEGLVYTKCRKGIFVANVSKKEMNEIFEIRSELESLAAALASQRMTKNEYMQLVGVNKEISNALKKKEYEEIPLLDNKFHKIVVNASGNNRLVKAIESLHDYEIRCGHTYFKYDDIAEEVEIEHQQILKSIFEGDGDNAKLYTLNHFNKSGNTFLKRLK